MRVQELEPDVLVFHGRHFESLCTAVVHGREALLVDALAGREDALELRRQLEEERGLRVSAIVATHYMNDHMAGLRLFPGAQIVAQRFYMHTFLSQRGRTPEDDLDFVAPTLVFGDELTIAWGRHSLRLLHNPGHTLSTIAIDLPACDLAFSSDNVLGGIAYVSASAPELIDAALVRLMGLGRGRIVPGHVGVLTGSAPAQARHYLARLRERVAAARATGAAAEAVRAIRIEDCVAPGLAPGPFEREWHGQNLERILERRLF